MSYPYGSPHSDPGRGDYDAWTEPRPSGGTAPVVQQFMTRVFGWMAMGLGLTAFSAFLTVRTGLIAIVGSAYWLFVIAEIGLVVYLVARIRRMSPEAAIASFLAYSVLNGLTMGVIFLVYTAESIGAVFLVTAGTFGFMCVWGWTTKADLTRMGSLLFMALVGFLLGSVVNWFLQSEGFYYLLTYAGIVIFVGLTAYDTQKIKQIAAHGHPDSAAQQKNAILGALTLYLDFINLFLLLLRLMGNRR